MGYDPNNPYPVPLALRPAGEGLIAGIREWANNPLAFAWGTPTASPEPPKKADKKGTYTTPSSIKAQQEMAARFKPSSVSEAAALSGSKGLRFAGGLTDFATAAMPGFMMSQAAAKEAANNAIMQEISQRALAAGADQRAGILGASPDVAQRAAALQMQEQRDQEIRHLAQQKELFEYQKRMQDQFAQEEQQRNLKLLDSIPGAGGQQPLQPPPTGAPPPGVVVEPPTGAPPAAAPGPQAVAPPNPNEAFAERLVGGPPGHQEMSPKDKARVYLAFKERGKAADALTERGVKLTEGQTKDAGFAERMLRSEAGLREVVPTDDKGKFLKYDPTLKMYRWMPDWNITNSAEWQKYSRNAREGVAAILRKDTGAAVSDSEWNWYFPMYYPQPGDSAQNVADKERARIAVARGLRNASGPAFDQMFPRFNEELRARLLSQGADLTPKGPPAGERRAAAPAAAPASPELYAKDASDIGIPLEKASLIPEGGEISSKSRGKVYVRQNGRLVEKGAVDAGSQAEAQRQYAPTLPNPHSNFDEYGRFRGAR